MPTVLLVILTGLVLISHVTVGAADSSPARNLFNSMHAPVFAFAAGIALAVFRKLFSARPGLAYWAAAALCFIAGLASEIIQYFGPRDASLSDLGYDMIGTGCTLFLAASFDGKLISAERVLLRVSVPLLAAILLYATLKPILWHSYVFLNWNGPANQILTFDRSWEVETYSSYGGAILSLSPRPLDMTGTGPNALKIISGTSQYSGVTIEPPKNWSNYNTFTFTINTTNQTINRWWIRINDSSHNGEYDDRFNSVLVVGPTLKRVQLSLRDIQSAPKHRSMDLTSMTKIGIFFEGTDHPSAIVIDDLKLENL